MSRPVILFIIGGQRCGTTFLLELLRDRPNTFLLNRNGKPEPRAILEKEYPRTAEEYLNRLGNNISAQSTELVVEKSTSYYESKLALSRFESGFIGSKFAVVLRDPVERALSNYFFSVRNGFEYRTIEEAFGSPLSPQPQNVSVNPFDYVGRSEYAKHLSPWINSSLGPDLLFIRYDELISNPERLLARIFNFLGCSDDLSYIDRDALTTRVNSGTTPTSYAELKLEIPSSVLAKLTEERELMELLLDDIKIA